MIGLNCSFCCKCGAFCSFSWHWSSFYGILLALRSVGSFHVSQSNQMFVLGCPFYSSMVLSAAFPYFLSNNLGFF